MIRKMQIGFAVLLCGIVGGCAPEIDEEGDAVSADEVAVSQQGLSSGSVQLLVGDDNGRMWHTVRNTAGNWQQFGDVGAAAGYTDGAAGGTLTGGQSGTVHVMIVADTPFGPRPAMRHSIRSASGVWSSFNDIVGATGGIGMYPSSVDVAGTTHFVALNYDTNRLMHAMRYFQGSWRPFEEISTALNGTLDVVSLATASSNVHLCGLGGNGRFGHAIRTNGQWGALVDRTSEIGIDPNSGEPMYVSCAGVGSELHAVIVWLTPSAYYIYHTVRASNGTWQRVGELRAHLGYWGPMGVAGVETASASGELHVFIDGDTSGIMHTVRHADGSWQTIAPAGWVAGYQGSSVQFMAAD